MRSKELSYLAEMSIDCWAVEHPERLEGIEPQSISLPDECLLLFVSPVKPEGEIVVMFEKVLKSIKLSLNQARHIFPGQVSQVESEQLKWVWFAGCESTGFTDSNILTSPPLTDIDGNNQQRRALWQQICSYDK